MDRQLREQIKHDPFKEKFWGAVGYLTSHTEAIRKYGGIVLIAVLVVAGIVGFINFRTRQRQAALREASKVLDAFVGQNSPYGGLEFKTQPEKDLAVEKAYSEVAQKYPGTREGQLARFHAGTTLCDLGKVSECEAALKEVANGSDEGVASLGKLSLATLYHSQGRDKDAEPLLRQLVDHPTPLVSKEQAQIRLAQVLMKSKPQEARTMLEQLQTLDRPAVTRAAVGVLGEMMNAQPR